MSPKEELVKEWLKLADDDLEVASMITNSENPAFWAAAFHCQQAAEKSLKAFLAFNEYHVEKTHEIEFLINLSMEIQPDIQQFLVAGEELSDYAVDSRYPGPKFEITQKKAEEALETARQIYEFVLKSLPDL